ncbi:hypothetical protein CEXT_654681 [Caerostris extrusa]|uniref:Uncharacterized protein n=1 Tax=Caerostris extrusa TaxID=172846 RepID=A0AAV4V9P6_CAEEX|nr:hypothetical protein CEXT_654681 [Caerostris extrusa]
MNPCDHAPEMSPACLLNNSAGLRGPRKLKKNSSDGFNKRLRTRHSRELPCGTGNGCTLRPWYGSPRKEFRFESRECWNGIDESSPGLSMPIGYSASESRTFF